MCSGNFLVQMGAILMLSLKVSGQTDFCVEWLTDTEAVGGLKSSWSATLSGVLVRLGY